LLEVFKKKCGGAGWLDNDPHFWTQPPTWGILPYRPTTLS